MTYEERKKKYCENCFKAYPSCAYKSRNLEDKCGVLENIMNGWELGYQDAVEKVAEWIKNNRDDDFFELVKEYNYCGAGHLNVNRMVEEFKKYMEE